MRQVHPATLLILRASPVQLFGNKLHCFLQMRNILSMSADNASIQLQSESVF